jgi:hypothetical protein
MRRVTLIGTPQSIQWAHYLIGQVRNIHTYWGPVYMRSLSVLRHEKSAAAAAAAKIT